MSNFKERYGELDQKRFELIYDECHPFIHEHWKKVGDWSRLWFNYYDHQRELHLKYGPQRSFPIPQIEEGMNKDRTPIKTLEIGFDEETRSMDSLTVNGLKFYVLDEELVVTIAGYIEKRIG